MVIVHTSDWHIGKQLFDYSLLENQLYFLEQLNDYLQKNKVDVLIIAGDIYDRIIPSLGAIKLLDDAFFHITQNLKVKIIAISGNHDSGSRLGFGSRLYSSSNLFVAGTVKKELEKITIDDENGSVNFFLLPYIQPSDVRPLFPECEIKTFDDAYRVLIDYNINRIDFAKRNILVAHGFFSNIKEKTEPITSESEISLGGMDIVSTEYFKGFDYVALGHLHTPQRVQADIIRYSGSPIAYSVSEHTQKKSVTKLVFSEKEHLEVQTHPIKALRKIAVIQGTFAQLIDPMGTSAQQKNNYVSIRITDTPVAYAIERLRILYPHILGLSYIQENGESLTTTPVVEQIAQQSLSESFACFYESIRGEQMSEKQIELINEIFYERAEKE